LSNLDLSKVFIFASGSTDGSKNSATAYTVTDANYNNLFMETSFKDNRPMTQYSIKYLSLIRAIGAIIVFEDSKSIPHNHTTVILIDDNMITSQLKLQCECNSRELSELRKDTFALLGQLKEIEILNIDEWDPFEMATIEEVRKFAQQTRKTNHASKRISDEFNLYLQRKAAALTVQEPPKDDTRPSWDEYFMKCAKLAATRSSCLRRKVGAVLVKDNREMATGYNGAPKDLKTCLKQNECMREIDSIPSGTKLEYCRGLHAEMNALLQCAIYGVPTGGSTIYVTHFPCSLCTKMLIQCGIQRIVYEQGYPDDFAKVLLSETNIKVEQMEVK
jgi:dCMP deaminase